MTILKTELFLAFLLVACSGPTDPPADGSVDAGSDAEAHIDADEPVDADPEEDAEAEDSGGDADSDADESDGGDADDPDPLDEPIETPEREWTWVDFPETRCGNGSATGLGINLAPDAEYAFIYLEGGGACWDYSSCFGVVPTSMHLGGFDGDDFNGLITSVYLEMPLFDREDAINPLADAHYVFIPYCTGDVFSGDSEVELEGLLPWERETIHFHGARNIQEYLERLVPTFEGVDRVIISGSSAGGFGAGLTWPVFQEAFGDTRVDVLDDSGPPINPSEGLWEQWVEVWNMQFPADCIGCETGAVGVVDYFRAELFDRGRFGLISYHTDLIIGGFFGLEPAQFEENIDMLMDTLDEEPNAQYFVIDGISHTLLIAGYRITEAPNGLPLWRWVEQMIDDDPDWESIRP